MSLRARIAAAAGVAVALVVLLTAVFTYVAVRSELRGQVDDALRQRAGQVAEIPIPPDGRPGTLAPGPGVTLRIQRSERLRPNARFGGAAGYAQLITSEGEVIGPPGDVALPVPARAHAIARTGQGSYITDATVDDTHVRVFTQARAGGGAVQVARPLDEIDTQLSRILTALIVIGLLGIVGGVAVGALVARTALVPIGRFTARTETLSVDPDLSQRMDVVGNDELARLARSFNTSLDALEQSVQSQRQLVADASHELRTPMASLRANIQLLQDADRLSPEDRAQMRADIIGELDELTALVGDVVELARGTKPVGELDDVALDDLVGVLVARAQRRAGTAVDFRTVLEPTLVQGEPERIARAVSNLLGNAVKWSPPGGAIEVRLSNGVLTVRDHGPGFDEADLPHVFQRFYRAATARGTPGSGLGLAIVQQAAEAHGGSVSAANAPGGGALLRVGFGPVPAVGEPPQA